MPSTANYSACFVCGRLTALKCRPCTDAGVDLFFCSPECQKLVWFAHRQVCGPGKANPPCLPELSPGELQSARERSRNPIVTGGGHPMTLAGDLEGVSHDRFETVMNFIGGPVNECSALPNKPYLVSIVRSTRWSDPTQKPNISLRGLPDKFVIDHVSKLICGVCSSLLGADILPEKVIETSWWTSLIHRLVLLSATVKVALETCDPKYFAWACSARLRLVQWLHGGMNIGDAALKAALADYDPMTTELRYICSPRLQEMLRQSQQ
ncbi:putative hemagglutinin [Rhodotorula toruloides ATCC 204091]|uniref:Putative hemagglutinin n=1 Tax=Rhodotorula toruloides TaxID=5286 RepID=A0A0K3CJK1_RHOTO|nr:putative hemagglutinin [Rhodotorula toruloides ATCC 204091]PRQ72401.1 putative hemagglutinin [Rhodotorula toruloides]